MASNSFIKLVIKFTVLFGVIIWLVGGSIFLSYKFLKGDYSITKSIGKIAQKFKDKPRLNGIILGTDKSEARTDFIMFVSYNPNNNKINIISIPRDTRVENSIDGKINSLYLKGKERAVLAEVQKIFKIPIQYYAVVNLNGFKEIVDKIGGIPINVPIDMKYYDPYQNLKIDINKGYQILDGNKAEGFVRFRSGYSNGDLGRINAQQAFAKAAISQLLKSENIPKIPSIVNIVLRNVKTNVPKTEILKYIDDATKIKMENIVLESLPGEPKYINGISYFVHNKSATRQMIEAVIYDGVPEETLQERNSKYTIEVLNGTNIPGLAMKTATTLRQKGFVIKRVGNSDIQSKTTKIINRNSKSVGNYVKSALNTGKISSEYYEYSDIDVTIIVGEDL